MPRFPSISTLLLLAVLGVSLGLARRAFAGGFAVPEIGTRKTAMGAVIGRPDDLAAVYHNPAGLALNPGTNLYVNTGLALPETNIRLRPWTGSDGYLDAPVDADGYYPTLAPSRAFAVIPMIVASTNLLNEKLSAALSLYVPNAAGAAFDENSVGRYHLVDSWVVAGFSGLTVAYRPRDWLAFGAGFSLIYVKLHARRYFYPVVKGLDLGPLIGKDTMLEIDGSDLKPGFNLGVLLQPLSCLSFGAALISRTDVSLEGPITLTLGPDALAKGEFVGSQNTELMLPWTVQWGLNWQATRWIEIGAEWRYYVYSQFQQQRTTIEGIELIENLVTELVTPKDYHDSWQVSGGFRVTVPWIPALEVMLGTHYDHSPAPDRTVSAEQPTFNHLGLHTGARYRFDDRFRLSFTYMRTFYLERRTDESQTEPPSNFIGSGANNILSLVLEVHLGRGLGVKPKTKRTEAAGDGTESSNSDIVLADRRSR